MPELERVRWPGATWRRRLTESDRADLTMLALAILAALPWAALLAGWRA